MKAYLYSTASGWNNRHTSVETALGIPTSDGKTTQYATIVQVDNEDHDDHGKYIFPVKTTGTWKCDQLFSGGLVDYDNTWFASPEE